MPIGMPNSPEMIKRVLALYVEGHSASSIALVVAEEFGAVKTRNAIIGIIHRSGVRTGPARSPKWRVNRDGERIERNDERTRKRPAKAIVVPAPRAASLMREQSRVSNNHVGGRALRPAPVALSEVPVAPDGGVPLMDLRDHHCRAISGRGADGLATFCGADKASGSYCAAHSLRYFASRTTLAEAAE